MAQPKFLLQPVAAAVCVACYSASAFADQTVCCLRIRIVLRLLLQPHSRAMMPMVWWFVPIQNNPFSRFQPQMVQTIYKASSALVQSNSGAGTNGDVTFRGMFGSRIKILTDGSENLGACPSRMDSPTSYISPESFDEITVIKGPQTVQYANTGSAATVLFERKPEQFGEGQNYRGQASVLMGSFGRLDHNVEAAAGDEQKYIRLNANRSVADSYKDGNGTTVPSDWERWNADVALGWTPDENTWLELTGGRGDAEVVYAGRMMDGSEFDRESLGLRVEKKNITDVIKKIEAQVNYSFNDHVMDNYSLREFKPT